MHQILLLLLLSSLLPLTSARPPNLNNHHSTSPTKYFHETLFSAHYSSRSHATHPLNYPRQRLHLSALVGSYLYTTSHILNATTWLAHGTLLGWWWNGQIMPWDDDIDVMVDERSMGVFAAWNMSTWTFRLEEGKQENRTFMLEVNPKWREGGWDGENMIDARWIDVGSGVFIDITTLRGKNGTGRGMLEGDGDSGEMEEMVVKDGHHYFHDDVFPLRESEFEGVPAMVPFAYPQILVEEYGEKALVEVYHARHLFDEKKGKWEPHLAPWLGEESSKDVEWSQG